METAASKSFVLVARIPMGGVVLLFLCTAFTLLPERGKINYGISPFNVALISSGILLLSIIFAKRFRLFSEVVAIFIYVYLIWDLIILSSTNIFGTISLVFVCSFLVIAEIMRIISSGIVRRNAQENNVSLTDKKA